MIEIDGVYQKVVKQSNRRKIFNHIKKKRQITKLDLARDLDLSITTVSSNIRMLKERGYVSDERYDESTGGRKAKIIELQPNARFSIGCELKENHARIVLMNLEHAIAEQQYINTVDLHNLPGATISIIDSFIEQHGIAGKIAGIGISLPGIVDSDKQRLVNAPNMMVENVDFRPVKEHFSCSVYIENEANCAAFAEFNDRNIEGSLCYVSITEGIGGALIFNNRLINGRNNRAGEVGHMVIVKDGRECHCGNRGCWEQYASEHALGRMLDEVLNERLSIPDAFRRYATDSAVRSCIESYAEHVAAGICNVLMMFDPGRIIIGGTVADYAEVLNPLISNWILERTHFYRREELSIGFSSFGSDAGVIGAGLFPLIDMF
ncbi:MAG: ROK family transcriptional regulator [Spirochaetota bacterium]